MLLLDFETRRRFKLLEDAALVPNAEQQLWLEAAAVGDPSRVLTVAGDTAEIEVSGLLSNAPNFLAMIFGGGNTTYPDINAAIASAINDDAVSEIVFAIDSPGGEVDGLFTLLEVIAAIKKPTIGLVSNKATSAAFALAAQTNRIVATHEAAMVGSIGVAVEMGIDENRIAIASRDAPKKRPDVSTPEGVAVVQDQLDPMHLLFVEAIARGRSAARGTEVTVDEVNSKYGEGAVLTAREALAVNMIDEVSERSTGTIAAPDSGIKAEVENTQLNTNEQGGSMNESEFKAAHPETYAAVMERGVKQERDRVTAHLIYGEGMDAMGVAVKAIKEGDEVTAKLQAEYMVAGQNKTDGDNAISDSEAAAAALEEATAIDESTPEGKEAVVLAKLIALRSGKGLDAVSMGGTE